MNKQKQIEEMRKDIYECDPTECCFGDQCEKCPRTEITKALYDKGYRKQEDADGWKEIAETYQHMFENAKTDVAREIFAEIEKEIKSAIAVNYKAREARRNRGYSEINDNMISSIWAKINTLRGIFDFIEELKKKYEVQEDEDRISD